MSTENVNVYQRDVLHRAVWARPLRDVARDYGISDVALARVCRRLEVPVPGRGYWAKRAAGNATPAPSLKSPSAGTPRELRLTSKSRGTRVAPPDEILARVAREHESAGAIVVREGSRRHGLVAATLRVLRDARVHPDGRLHGAHHDALDIIVAPASLDRALAVFDALISGLSARGLPVRVTQRGRERTRSRAVCSRVTIDEVDVDLRIVEPTILDPESQRPAPSRRMLTAREAHFERLMRPPLRYVPSGSLQLMAEGPTFSIACRDGREQRIEHQLDVFLTRMYALIARGERRRTRLCDDDLGDDRHRLPSPPKKRVSRVPGRAAARGAPRPPEERATAKRDASSLHDAITQWRLARDLRDYAMALARVDASDPHIALALAEADALDPVGSVRAPPG